MTVATHTTENESGVDGLQRLYVAAGCLVANGDLAARLHNAALEVGVLNRHPNSTDFPTDEARERHASIMAALTSMGSFEASIAAMTIEQREGVARQILDLFVAVARAATSSNGRRR